MSIETKRIGDIMAKVANVKEAWLHLTKGIKEKDVRALVQAANEINAIHVVLFPSELCICIRIGYTDVVKLKVKKDGIELTEIADIDKIAYATIDAIYYYLDEIKQELDDLEKILPEEPEESDPDL